jgi:hypothetical protein
MRRFVAVLLCFLFPVTVFANDSQNGYKVVYDGGSLTGLKSGTGVRLVVGEKDFQIVQDKTVLVTVPASSVTEISYGQDVHRRVGAAIGIAVFTFGLGALMALSKSKKHYVGLTWANGDAKGGFAMQCDKNEYRGILAALEGISGRKAIDSDAMNVKN